jgi:uncharacterized protein
MFRSILPKEFQFFDYFEKHMALTVECCGEFLKLASEPESFEECSVKIQNLEHELDKITHICVEALHKTFITPFDRVDIHSLIKRMDDIADFIDNAVSRMKLYEVRTPRPDVKEIAQILLNSTTEIGYALKGLRNMKDTEYIKQRCITIRNYENLGDLLFQNALSNLFKETDAVLVIKWKEIYERLEKAVDRCEGIANIIEGIVLASA